jgi:tRNA nucleotidyltransferase/poly(A) polymerase
LSLTNPPTVYTIELTPPKKEGFYDPIKRTPSYVMYTSLEEDANRRDLTINSLYQNIVTGEIKDFTGGLKDLREKKLKPPSHPEGIQKIYEEDPLRIFRIIRFYNKLEDFKIDSNTEKILKNFINSNEGKKLIKNKVAPDRIREEFIKILTNSNSNKVIESIELLKEYNLISFISNELLEIINKNWNEIKQILKNSPLNLKVRLSALLHSSDDEIIEKILRDLKFPNNIISSVKKITKSHTLLKDKADLSQIRKFIEYIYDDLEEAIEFIKVKNKEKTNDIYDIEQQIKKQKEKDLSKGLLKNKKYIYPLTGEQIIQEWKITGPLLGAIKEKLKQILLEGHFDNLEEKTRIEKAKKILKNLISDEKNINFILK